MKNWREFLGEANRRDGDVWQTDGGWAAQARGVVDYFDSRESAEAYAKGYSSQRRGAFTRTGGQSRETKAKMSEPRRVGRMLGGDIQEASGKQEAMRSIANWKNNIKMVEDHIKFLQDKRLGSMKDKLKIAEKKFDQGDYDWISRELFFNGDLY